MLRTSTFFKAVYTEYDVANVKRMWVLMSEDNCAHVSFSPTFYAHKKFFMQIFINSTWVPMGRVHWCQCSEEVGNRIRKKVMIIAI